MLGAVNRSLSWDLACLARYFTACFTERNHKARPVCHDRVKGESVRFHDLLGRQAEGGRDPGERVASPEDVQNGPRTSRRAGRRPPRRN